MLLRGARSVRENSSFAPAGAGLFPPLHPRLTAWAAFFRRFAATTRHGLLRARRTEFGEHDGGEFYSDRRYLGYARLAATGSYSRAAGGGAHRSCGGGGQA